jgi:hypothetical protein
MQALNGIGPIDDLFDLGRIGKEWNALLLLALPHRRHGREFVSPWSGGKRVQRHGCQARIGRLVNRLERRCQFLTVLPCGQRRRVADQMHNAGLELGLRIDRRGCRSSPVLQVVEELRLR